MSIKFVCPHCKKALKVKEELIGKKAKCPGCQKVITIVAPPPPKPAPKPAPVPEPTQADIEELAADALKDQPPPTPPPAEEKGTIDFRCDFCDEELHLSADLAGKQTPCPSCRRIIKVPMPVKTQPKDWRKPDSALPSGARRDTEPAPEGAWGTATSAGRVSAQALLEAEAVPVPRERVTVRQWIVRIMGGVAAVALLVFAVWGMRHYRHQNQENQALALALESLQEGHQPPLPWSAAAELNRGAGEYYLRADDLEEANKHFHKARASSLGHDPALLDLALSQVNLAGDQKQVNNRVRVTWDAAQKEVQQSLRGINTPEARVEAIRQVSRELIARGQGARAVTLANMLGHENESAEMLGVIGLEMLKAGQTQEAGDLARQAIARFEVKPPAGAKEPPKRPVVPHSLLALLLAVGDQARAEALVPRPKPTEDVDDEVRIGYAQGLAYQDGKLPEARDLLVKAQPLQRLVGFIGMAAAQADKNSTEAQHDVEAAAKLMEGELKGKAVSPWVLLHLIQVGIPLGMADRLRPLIDKITDNDVRERAQVEFVRSRLANQNQADMDGLTQETSAKPANPLVVEFMARHNARFGGSSSVTSAISAWDQEAMRPYGYMGVALGVQDNTR